MRTDIKDITGHKFGLLTAVEAVSVNSRIYWDCTCSCGGEHSVRGDMLRSGKITHCGCQKKKIASECKKLPEGVAHINIALHFYKKGAKDRRLIFDLTREQFIKLISGSCNYCGIKPTIENVIYARKELSSLFPMNGIDRVDSTKGYFIDNTVSCCKKCNQIKMDMTMDDFVNQIIKISEHLNIVGRTGEKMIKTHNESKKEF